MKRLILALFILGSINLFAQSGRQYVSLSAGPSFPLNDFAKADLTDSTSGFAKTGLNLKLIYSYKITHNFGLQAHFVVNVNNIDLQAIKDEANELFDNYSFSIQNSNTWNCGGIYVSPFLRFPITEKLVWEIKGDLGFTGAYSPQYTIKGTDLNTQVPTEYYRNSAKAFGFGVGAGTSILYQLKKYMLSVNVDYFHSNLNFKKVSGWGWTSPDNPEGTPYEFSAKSKITVASVSLGVAYRL